MDQRTRRSPARFLAPLALIAFAIVFFSMISSSGSDSAKQSDSKSAATSTTKKKSSTGATKTTKAAAPAKKKPKTYTVQAGDTLGAIAEKTGVPLTTIQELNPAVDSTALTTGQKIKLEE